MSQVFEKGEHAFRFIQQGDGTVCVIRYDRFKYKKRRIVGTNTANTWKQNLKKKGFKEL